jgi:molybdopterin synthase catalytic subunit
MNDQKRMINVKVLFFASIKERAGMRIHLQVPDALDVSDFKRILAGRYPGIADSLNTAIVAINREFAYEHDQIPENAEIAIFPPVSGGTNREDELPTIISITDQVINMDELVSQITLPSVGAACIFSGFVRGVTTRGEARETIFLEYDAYHEMAELKIKKVIEEIRNRWPSILGIAIVQRIGVLYPGTPTVLIACTAAHRDTGIFEAARYGIDRLKEIVPIWKKEVGARGEVWVEGEYYPKPGE